MFINKRWLYRLRSRRRIDKINYLKLLEIKNLEIAVTICKSMVQEIRKIIETEKRINDTR